MWPTSRRVRCTKSRKAEGRQYTARCKHLPRCSYEEQRTESTARYNTSRRPPHRSPIHPHAPRLLLSQARAPPLTAGTSSPRNTSSTSSALLARSKLDTAATGTRTETRPRDGDRRMPTGSSPPALLAARPWALSGLREREMIAPAWLDVGDSSAPEPPRSSPSPSPSPSTLSKVRGARWES